MRSLPRAAALLLLAPLSFSGAACGSGEGARTDADHTDGNYAQDNSPYWWASSSYDEFRAVQATLDPTPLPPALTENDPLTIRVQTWLDRVDAIVRKEMTLRAGAAFAAPRPIARVLTSPDQFNAWVSGTPVCLGGTLGARDPHEAATSLAFLSTTGTAPLQGVGGAPASCLRPEIWKTADAVKFWNADRPACTLSHQEGTFSVGGRSCALDASVPAGAELTILAASPYVQFTTDLIAQLDENTLAVVAAHELGHYYRGHATSKGDARYNYWYARDAQQNKVPASSQLQAELKAAYQEAMGPAGLPATNAAFTSKYSARMRPFLVFGIGPLLRERTETNFVCAAARDALGPLTDAVLGSEAPSEESRTAFKAFELKLANCAARLNLDGEPSASSISLGSVVFAASQYRPGPKVKVALQLGENLGDLVGRLDAQAKEIDAKAARLVTRARENKVGLYTQEQEADDFALELSTKLGIPTQKVLESWLQFMQASEAVYRRVYSPEELSAYFASVGEKTADECKALLDAGFTTSRADGTRTPVTMSLGQLDEPHHTSCYRLYNLWLEGKSHGYVVGPAQLPLSPSWDVLRAGAARLSQ